MTPITYSWATMSTEENNPSNASACSLPTRSNTRRISSYSGEITSVQASIESMGSMMNVRYGFILGKRKYNLKLWKTFSDVFNVMPVCALIDEKILCMHGGISPQLENF